MDELYELVEEACKKESNHFGYGIWSHHIKPSIKFGKELAEKKDANKKVVELALLFHDYASVVDYDLYKEHHKHGARLAEEILQKRDFSEEVIEKVKHCIKTHRASEKKERKTLEADIVANADAMSHFSDVDSLLYLAYVQHEKNIDEGTQFVLNKLERSWKKLMPEAKEIVRERYEAIKAALK